MSHLESLREALHGPIQLNSAFPWEDHYGEIRSSFQTGCKSTTLQIINNILFKRQAKGTKHICQPSISLRDCETHKTDDTLFYTYTEEDGFQFFKVRATPNCQEVVCSEIIVELLPSSSYGLYLHWSLVGCFKFVSVLTQKSVMKRSSITGKAMKVKNLILTVPPAVLFEAN